MTFGRPVACLASFTAASVASAPELAKKNVSIPAGVIPASRAAELLEQGMPVAVHLRVDEPRGLLLDRGDDRGWQCPVLVTAMPLVKSRYSVPSVVTTVQPEPDTTGRSVTWNHTSARWEPIAAG